MNELRDFFDRYTITPNEVLGQADYFQFATGKATTLNDVGLFPNQLLGQADYKDWVMGPRSFASPAPMGLPPMPPRNPFLC